MNKPFGGRRGRQLANEQREKYFRAWHQVVLERLVIESSIILDDYAQEVVLQAITQMWNWYYSTQCYPGSEAFLKKFTEMCTQQLVANVRAILENHVRVMGGSLLMEELVMILLVLMGIVAYYAAIAICKLLKLMWRFALWLSKPIRDEIALQCMIERERRKEEQIRQVHEQAIQDIDRTAAYFVQRQEEAADARPQARMTAAWVAVCVARASDAGVRSENHKRQWHWDMKLLPLVSSGRVFVPSFSSRRSPAFMGMSLLEAPW